MPKTYTIDGMVYRSIEKTTMANDFYIMKLLRASGLSDLLRDENRTAEDFANNIITVAVDSGIPLALLGGTLLPEGIPDEKWTAELAAATTARLSAVSDAEDKATIQAAVVEVIAAFFAAGLLSLKLSPHASETEGEEAQTPAGVMNSSATTEIGEQSYVN